MLQPQRKRNTKVLSPLDTIEFLNRLKTQSLPMVAKHFLITLRAAQYHKKKYGAHSDEDIDHAIHSIERKIHMMRKSVPVRNYEKEEACQHTFCTLFMRCPFCTLVVGENELEKAINILLAKREALGNKNLIEVKL